MAGITLLQSAPVTPLALDILEQNKNHETYCDLSVDQVG